jgi:Holliday junction resolvasome RuvABC endonuclease subunit
MTIIGIDPGSTHSGVCVIGPIVGTANIKLPNIMSADKICNDELRRTLRSGWARHCEIAIEDFISYQFGKSSDATSQFIGMVKVTAEYEQIPLTVYTRRDYGQWITAGGKLTDATLRAGLESIYGPSGKKGDPLYLLRGATDKRSAFAIAKYHEFMMSRVAVAGGV